MSTTLSSRQRKGLRAIVAATYASALGDGAFLAATPLAAAAITRSPSAVSLVAAVQYIPWLLVSPFAGALVDRWPKRAVLILADAVRAIALVVLTVIVLLKQVSIPALAAVACLVVVGQIFADTASQSIVVQLAGRETADLNKANGHISSAGTVGKSLAGPPIGSGSFAALPWLPFALDAASFAFSAWCLKSLPHSPDGRPADPSRRLIQAIAEGARFLVRHPTLRILCLLVAAANLANFMALATFVLYATERLGVSVAAFGALMAAGSIGGVIGGFASSRVVRRLGARGAMTAGVAVGAISWPALSLMTSPWPAAAILALVEFCAAVTTVVAISSRQQMTPPEMLGRVISAFRTVGAGAAPLGALAGGLTADALGLSAPLYAAGAVLFAALLLTFRLRIARQ